MINPIPVYLRSSLSTSSYRDDKGDDITRTTVSLHEEGVYMYCSGQTLSLAVVVL